MPILTVNSAIFKILWLLSVFIDFPSWLRTCIPQNDVSVFKPLPKFWMPLFCNSKRDHLLRLEASKRKKKQRWREDGCSFFFLLNETRRDTYYTGGYPCALLPRHPFISPFFFSSPDDWNNTSRSPWWTISLDITQDIKWGSGYVCNEKSWRHNAYPERFKAGKGDLFLA